MKKLTYTNARGESVVFSNHPPFILSKFEGLGDVNADVQSQKSPFQDGSTHVDTILDPRYIDLEVAIVAENIDERRRELARIMNPKIKGKLRYEDEKVVREIECINEHVPNFPTKHQSFNLARINMIAHDPYWQDTSPSVDEMSVFVGMFEFPLEIPHDEGIEFGQQGEKIKINNPGDVETPVRIEFNGPAVNPKVTNVTTGEYILVDRAIGAEQKLVITTDFGNKSVEIYDENGLVENAFHWIDLNSTFWQLIPGENVIQYGADIGMDTAKILITRHNRYVGI